MTLDIVHALYWVCQCVDCSNMLKENKDNEMLQYDNFDSSEDT